MPSPTDWILLRKTINHYGGEPCEKWGEIDSSNVEAVANQKCDNKCLFEFLLMNDHIHNANTLASCLPLFDDENVQFIYNSHHSKYIELLKIICTDQLILLYESYQTDNDDYRTIISIRYEKMLASTSPNDNDPIMDLLYEFKFLIHYHDFYDHIISIKSNNFTNDFCHYYQKYLEFIPLIYRLINEYYLSWIKHQLQIIIDIGNSSYIIIVEHYEYLMNCLKSLPVEYMDYRYQDNLGNNILLYLATLPHLSDTINSEIFQEFFNKHKTIPLDIKNIDGNTMFHMVAEYENVSLLIAFKEWVSENPTNIIRLTNNDGRTMFDILMEKNNFNMIAQIIEYLTPNEYTILTKYLTAHFGLLDSIPVNSYMQNIYVASINCYMQTLYDMKQNILFDKTIYSDISNQILKLVDKHYDDELPEQHIGYYLEWLRICMIITEDDLFKKILLKYFSRDLAQFLNRILPSTDETLTMLAIRQQNLCCMKLLFDQNINLAITNNTGLNAIIIALGTTNLSLLKLIQHYVQKDTNYHMATMAINNYIELLGKQDVLYHFSIIDIITKLYHKFYHKN